MTLHQLAAHTLSAVVILALAGLATAFARWRTAQLRTMQSYREHFYNASGRLINDTSVPLEVLDFLSFLIKQVDKPRLGRKLLLDAITGNLYTSFRRPSQKTNDLVQAVANMRPDLQRDYFTAVSSFLIAATFANVFLGPFIRRLMLYWAEDNAKTRDVSIVASSVEGYEARHRRRQHAQAI